MAAVRHRRHALRQPHASSSATTNLLDRYLGRQRLPALRASRRGSMPAPTRPPATPPSPSRGAPLRRLGRPPARGSPASTSSTPSASTASACRSSCSPRSSRSWRSSQAGRSSSPSAATSILLLLLETGVLGAFLALDFFLFYIFYEVMLLPMYFLIGVWGGGRRRVRGHQVRPLHAARQRVHPDRDDRLLLHERARLRRPGGREAAGRSSWPSRSSADPRPAGRSRGAGRGPHLRLRHALARPAGRPCSS